MKIYVWFIQCLLLLFSVEANARVIKAKPGEGIEFYSGSTKLKEMGSTGLIVNGPSADNAGFRVYDFQGYPNGIAGNSTLRILQTSANNRNVLALDTNTASSINFDLITARIDVDGTPREVFSLRGDGQLAVGPVDGVGLNVPHEIEGPASGSDFALKLNINKDTAYGFTVRSDIAISPGYPMIQVYDGNNSQELFIVRSEGALRAGPTGTGTDQINHIFRSGTGTGADAYFILKSGNAGNSVILFDENTISRWWMGHVDGTSSAFTMGTGGSAGGNERLRLKANGELEVGHSTSGSSHKFYVSSASITKNFVIASTGVLGNTVANRIVIENNTTGTAEIGAYKNPSFSTAAGYVMMREADGSNNQHLWSDTVGVLRISNSFTDIGGTGGNIVGTQTSDERLKENIQPLSKGLETILALANDVIEFDLYGKHKVGFSAQKTLPILPTAVYQGNMVDPNDPSKGRYYSMDYTQIIAPLVKAVKELSVQNKCLANADTKEARLACF